MTTVIITGKQDSEIRKSGAATGWLGLAASPTFALMTWISANDMGAIICSSGLDVLPVNGMAWMYFLMSVFHLSPWLRFLSGRPGRFSHPVAQAEGE